MKVSVIISICDNRELLFERALITYMKQSLLKNEFEIIIIDDKDRKEIYNLCKKYNGLNFQYVRVDTSKSFYTPKSFTPALTNNIGFRLAKGNIIVVTGPETLQSENNLSYASMISKKECYYGLVYRASKIFENNLKEWESKDFSYLLNLPGAKADCRTCPPHPPAYWYFMAVKKEYVLQINGIDERFLGGICGEDDDFANRMKFLGVIPKFDHRIIGIHQDHELIDKKDNEHNIRFTEKWTELKNHNLKIMKENLQLKKAVINEKHEWGDLNLIISKEILY